MMPICSQEDGPLSQLDALPLSTSGSGRIFVFSLDCLFRPAFLLKTILRQGAGDMPTYEYRCENCRKEFSRVETISQHGKKRPKCPKCGSAKVMQVFRPFFAKTSKKS